MHSVTCGTGNHHPADQGHPRLHTVPALRAEALLQRAGQPLPAREGEGEGDGEREGEGDGEGEGVGDGDGEGVGVGVLYVDRLRSAVSLPLQLFDRMCVLLGGRLAEAVTFKKITTGPAPSPAPSLSHTVSPNRCNG